MILNIKIIDVKFNKLTKHKDIWEYLKSDTADFYSKAIQPEGMGYFLKGLSAKLLWVILWWRVGIELIPIKNALFLNATILVIGSGVLFLLNFLKEHLPESIKDIISGRVFLKIDVKALNRYIVGLVATHVIVLVYPIAFKQVLQYIKSSNWYEQK